MNHKYTIALMVLISFLFCGWGSVGHNIINTNTFISFPQQMVNFISWSTFLGQHASDADYRKGSDPDESPKHFIDIDEYSEFITNHRIIQDFDSITAKYGSSFVVNKGILPWAIITTFDSLKAQFSRRDWSKAQISAADLGHYIGDSYQPLHITKNYDGQYSGQTGVHSRYETSMIQKYQSSIQYLPETAIYISDVPDFIFSYLYRNYSNVDSLLNADLAAKSFAGSTSSDIYYQKLWEITGSFTIRLFSEASNKLGCLIYTAWVDAGSPDPNISNLDNRKFVPTDFVLFQNYPNPFNPLTSIYFSISKESYVVLKVFDILGQEIKTLLEQNKLAGLYKVDFDASGLKSGIYFYRLEAGDNYQVKKMMFLK